MIIVEISGGLGNQMFQYALYQKLKEQNPNNDVRIDLSFYRSEQKLRRFELDLFSASYDIASVKEVRKLRGYTYQDSLLDKIGERLCHREHHIYCEDLDKGYQPEIFELDEIYLSGYWQSERYFKNIGHEILDCYRFPAPEGKCKEYLLKIQNTEAVSIHIRRGDYLDEQNARIYGNICTLDYYKNAIKYIREHIENPVFYFFTNDSNWVEENLYECGMSIVTCNQGTQDYFDMYLMSQCKHNIIANSSFSWWGAWLNQNQEKIVVSPDRWFNNHSVSDAICEDWIRIKG